MQSFREPTPTLAPEHSVSISLPVDLAVGIATVPLLGLVTFGQVAAKGLIALGQASEELFRGDRLPVLPLIGTESENT